MYKYENKPFTSKIKNNSIDINETLLIYSTKRQNKKIVDIIINHPDFDKNKSKLNEAVLLSINDKNDFEIFRKLYALADSDLTNYSILSTIVSKMKYDNADKINEDDTNENIITFSEIFCKPGVKFSKDDINSAYSDLIKKREKN